MNKDTRKLEVAVITRDFDTAKSILANVPGTTAACMVLELMFASDRTTENKELARLADDFGIV